MGSRFTVFLHYKEEGGALKGLAHFASALALATCFPSVMTRAEAGSLWPVLAGLGALLPDLLDFRFVRYWVRYDAELDPGLVTDRPSACKAVNTLAERLVEALSEAAMLGEQRHIRLHTLQVGPDRWRRYQIEFDQRNNRLRVSMGPMVSGGQVPVPGTGFVPPIIAERALPTPVICPYGERYQVDILSGPSLLAVPEARHIRLEFLPWHHGWTHSLFSALMVGLGVAMLTVVLWGVTDSLWAGGLLTLGYVVHVLEDQLGHMGCSLWWPVRRRRVPGLQWLHASDGLPNFGVVWSGLSLILYNLIRLSHSGLVDRVGPVWFLVVGLWPWALLGLQTLLRHYAGLEAVLVRTSECQTEVQGPDFD